MTRFPLAATLAATLVAALPGCATPQQQNHVAVTASGAGAALCVGRLVVGLPTRTRSVVDGTFHSIETQQPKPATGFDAIAHQVQVKAKKFGGENIIPDPYSIKFWRAAGYDPDKLFSKTRLVRSSIDADAMQAEIGYFPDTKSPSARVELYKFARNTEYVFYNHDVWLDRYDEVANHMWSAASAFQPLSAGTIPSTSGFCVAGGMFADEGKAPLNEGFTLVVTFADHPDAQFSIDANAIDQVNTDEPSLSGRVDSELEVLRANVEGNVTVLERGPREAGGQNGYQIGLSVPNDTVANTTAYKFFWAADGVPHDATRPAMEVSLAIQPDTDKPASFATAAQARGLWNQLLAGLSIRQGSVTR